MTINQRIEADAYYQVLQRAYSADKFLGAHSMHTPQPLVEEILSPLLLSGKILVLFNVEFVISLVYTYNVSPDNITFCSDHLNKELICRKIGIVNIITSLPENNKNMKFDYGLANPPYTNGVWRKIIKKLMKITDHIALVAPDDRVPRGNQAKENLKDYVSFGLQKIENVDEHFPGVSPGAPIVLYFLDKTKPTDLAVAELTDAESKINQRILTTMQVSRSNSDRRFVRGLLQATPKRDGSLLIPCSDVLTEQLTTRIITSVDNSGVKEKYTNTTKRSFPGNYGRSFDSRLFVFNQYLGKNLNPKVCEITNAAEMKFGNNVLAYDPAPTDTVDGFISVYMSDLYRFLVAIQRGKQSGNRDAYFNNLPYMDLSKVWSNEEIYKFFNVHADDVTYISNYVRNMK